MGFQCLGVCMGETICETPEEIHGLENKSIALLNLFAFFSFKPLFGPILL